MKFKNLLQIIIFSFFSCNSDNDVDYPNCLQESIDFALSREPSSPRASIKKYLFNQEEVFLIEVQQGIADGMSTVVNEICEIVCSIGGIGGLVCDGFKEAEFIETVWKDSR